MSKRLWTREDLLLALDIYCRTPFGKIHKGNPEIISLAGALGRTPSAVAMKVLNFSSLDPVQRRRKIRGLSHASKADVAVWEEFRTKWDALPIERLAAAEKMKLRGIQRQLDFRSMLLPLGAPTEGVRKTRTRLVQRFFRDAVLASYDYACAVCGLALPELLNAGHIIPWSQDATRRADPTNGISFCALHDRAFDRGLFAVDATFHIIVSRKVMVENPPEVHAVGLIDIARVELTLPEKFGPDPTALAYHRENVFQG